MMIRLGSSPSRPWPRARCPALRRSAAKRSCARATIARSAGSPGGRSAPGAKSLRSVAKVLHRRGGCLAALELLAAPVDPDHGHVHLEGGSDVGVVAARDVQ